MVSITQHKEEDGGLTEMYTEIKPAHSVGGNHTDGLKVVSESLYFFHFQGLPGSSSPKVIFKSVFLTTCLFNLQIFSSLGGGWKD